MQNAKLDESQAGLKTAGKNNNSVRYADDAISLAEIDEELNSLLMKVEEENEKAVLKFYIRNLRSWHLASSFWGK